MTIQSANRKSSLKWQRDHMEKRMAGKNFMDVQEDQIERNRPLAGLANAHVIFFM
jgi:hypothetical protein